MRVITWLTFHDGTEPFKSMADDLRKSIEDTKAGNSGIIMVPPNGGHYLVEFYGAMYPIFSQAIQTGPVVILDADCKVNKPIDHLFEEDFVIAAVHRGKCVNTMGTHDFLGSFIGFHSKYPELCRHLWMSWMAHIFDFLNKEPVESAKVRRESITEKGWHPNWFGGQAAYNDILYGAEKAGIPIKRLDKNEYADRWKTEGAYIAHLKGEGKIVIP